jgi:hypothetical protein
VVVTDDERDRSVVRQRNVEPLCGSLHVRRVGADRGHALVEEEVRAAGEGHGEHHDGRREPEYELAEQAQEGVPVRRLAVVREGGEDVRRENGVSVAVHGRPATHASLERRAHRA